MPKPNPPGCGMILLGFLALFLLIALPAWLISMSHKRPPAPKPSAIERKVAEDLKQEEAAKQRAAQEALERIRQRSSLKTEH